MTRQSGDRSASLTDTFGHEEKSLVPVPMKSRLVRLLVVVVCGFPAFQAFATPDPSWNGASAAVSGATESTVVYEQCSWDRPGVNPFMGDLVAAVDRYKDIPADVRAKLKARMEQRDYDDLVSIRRDRIEGRGGYDYGDAITDMHFGTHQVCRTVTRAHWTPQMEERGLVYCEGGECILVPTVCRNVSRIARSGVGPNPTAGAPLLPAVADATPLIDWFGPPGAGYPAADSAPSEAVPGGGGPVLGDPVFGYPGSAGPARVGGGPAAAGTAGPEAGPGVPYATLGAGPGGIAGPMPVGGIPMPVGGAPGGRGDPVLPAVPEPQSWALLALGLGLGLAWRRCPGFGSRR